MAMTTYQKHCLRRFRNINPTLELNAACFFGALAVTGMAASQRTRGMARIKGTVTDTSFGFQGGYILRCTRFRGHIVT